MRTVLTSSPVEAARFVRAGEVVAFPTETVYGLGAAAFNEAAIRKIFAAKGRPSDNPLIAHVGAIEQIRLLAREVPPAAAALVEAFFPGPLTLVLPKRREVPGIATAGLDTVGVRMPRHPIARALLDACETPLVAPSANVSGRPSPTTWEAVGADLDGRIACILCGGPSEVGLESTVVDCTSEVPLVLRAGAVPIEAIRSVLPDVRAAFAGESVGAARSPGAKYRHYAPRALVAVVAAPEDAPAGPRVAFIGVAEPPAAAEFALCRVCTGVEEYARELFRFFRDADAAGVDLVCCQTVEESGLGVALMDRITRAARAHT